MKKKKSVSVIPNEIILNQIYYIREQKVMLDYDLAELYKVENKQLKRQVRRNKDRFPADFMFELTEKEHENLRCQFGSSSWGGIRYRPMVFTEQGVAMLSSVLNSERAIKVNIQIMRIFTRIRKMLMDNSSLRAANLLTFGFSLLPQNQAHNTFYKTYYGDQLYQPIIHRYTAFLNREENPQQKFL